MIYLFNLFKITLNKKNPELTMYMYGRTQKCINEFNKHFKSISKQILADLVCF